MKCKSKKGFTLMEILLAIGIVAALAAIALPTYVNYSRKANYSEIVQAVDKYRPSVSSCITSKSGEKDDCNGGTNGVNPDQTVALGGVASVVVVEGAITGTPTTSNGFTGADTYTITPTYSPDGITWIATGGGCDKGYAGCE